MAYFNEYIPVLKLMYPSYIHWNIKNNQQKIYLTFDDGPVPEITSWVLDTLRAFNIKATFFCVGDNIRKHPDLYQQVVSENHGVGNHTYNHIKGWDTEKTIYMSNVASCDEMIEKYGKTSKSLFRPPYGKATRAQLRSIHETHQIVMWDVLTGDFDQKQSPESCLKEALRRTNVGSIILFHDSIKAQRNLTYALPRFIEHSLKQGFQFDTI